MPLVKRNECWVLACVNHVDADSMRAFGRHVVTRVSDERVILTEGTPIKVFCCHVCGYTEMYVDTLPPEVN